jgi:hypothetical protein
MEEGQASSTSAHLTFSLKRGNGSSFTSISMRGGGTGLLYLHSPQFQLQEGERLLLLPLSA